MNKIFGIGFHRTGTTTLARALRILGFTCCGWRPGLLEAIKANNFAPVFQLVDQYDAFRDNPWPIIYKELDQHYPNSKFILTVRDADRWLRSVVRVFGERSTEMRQWIYGQGCPRGHEDLYIRRYQQHNQEVLAYFQDRPGGLLVVDWEQGDGWAQLCPFLGKAIPDVPFPWLNASGLGLRSSA